MAPFYLKGVAPTHVNINDIFRGVMPFIFIVLIAMVLLYVSRRSACGCRARSMAARAGLIRGVVSSISYVAPLPPPPKAGRVARVTRDGWGVAAREDLPSKVLIAVAAISLDTSRRRNPTRPPCGRPPLYGRFLAYWFRSSLERDRPRSCICEAGWLAVGSTITTRAFGAVGEQDRGRSSLSGPHGCRNARFAFARKGRGRCLILA